MLCRMASDVLQGLTSGKLGRAFAIGGSNDKCPLKQSRHGDRAVSKRTRHELLCAPLRLIASVWR